MESENSISGESWKGKLLVASPSLTEATFERTVILLLDHSKTDGAIGYVLNRSTQSVVGDLMEQPEFEKLNAVPVFEGGPVSQENLVFTSFGWNETDGKLQFMSHLSTAEANQHLQEGFSVRAFVGYSGWSAGQLEAEMECETWTLADPSRQILTLEALGTQLWGDLIRDLSPIHRLAADMPDDLSLN
tara:strand:+ start:17366 stop:17929 length:564 start_codon:yes stop_codon:yes gene_type:complete